MAQVKTSPLPLGRYWIYVRNANMSDYETWRKAAKASNETTVQQSSKSGFAWIVFTVPQNSVAWPSAALGWPSLAPAAVQRETDVSQTPDADSMTSLFAGIGPWALVALLVLLSGRKGRLF